MVARGIKNENLLPCPFCGSDAIMSGYSRKNGGEDWYIGCSRDNCIEFDTKFKCMADAENAWNRRATPQNQVHPLCEDCHTKMDEVRRAYDNAMKQESCDKCEVGNPCLYCKHEFEPQERSDKG